MASLMGGGFDMWTNTAGFSLLGTLGHGKSDAEATEEASKHNVIEYPKPDGKLSFDRLTNVSFANTNHAEDQPPHLTLKDKDVPLQVNLPRQPASVHMALPLQPKVWLAVHLACEVCLSSETLQGGPGGAGTAVQFMMGVVTTSGDAAMAHMENSVMYSSSVIVPSLPLACSACA